MTLLNQRHLHAGACGATMVVYDANFMVARLRPPEERRAGGGHAKIGIIDEPSDGLHISIGIGTECDGFGAVINTGVVFDTALGGAL